LKLDYTELSDITDKTLNDGIKATKIYFTPSINDVYVDSTITENLNGITFTSDKPLNKYLDIKDNHPIDRITDKNIEV